MINGRVAYVLHSSRDHEYLSGIQNDVAVAQLNVQRAVDDEEQLVRVRVRVPHEFAE